MRTAADIIWDEIETHRGCAKMLSKVVATTSSMIKARDRVVEEEENIVELLEDLVGKVNAVEGQQDAEREEETDG